MLRSGRQTRRRGDGSQEAEKKKKEGAATSSGFSFGASAPAPVGNRRRLRSRSGRRTRRRGGWESRRLRRRRRRGGDVVGLQLWSIGARALGESAAASFSFGAPDEARGMGVKEAEKKAAASADTDAPASGGFSSGRAGGGGPCAGCARVGFFGPRRRRRPCAGGCARVGRLFFGAAPAAAAPAPADAPASGAFLSGCAGGGGPCAGGCARVGRLFFRGCAGGAAPAPADAPASGGFSFGAAPAARPLRRRMRPRREAFFSGLRRRRPANMGTSATPSAGAFSLGYSGETPAVGGFSLDRERRREKERGWWDWWVLLQLFRIKSRACLLLSLVLAARGRTENSRNRRCLHVLSCLHFNGFKKILLGF